MKELLVTTRLLFLLNFINLVFWLCRVLVAAHGIFIEARGIFHCSARALHCGVRASL